MPTPSPAVTYIGGPTLLLEYAGIRILLDPTFDAPQTYADPGSTPLVKTVGPGVSTDELGPVDLVLLSHHEHSDNLDTSGLAFVMSSPLVLSTREAAADLGAPVVGLAPWQEYRLGDLIVTGVPARHGPPGSKPFVGPVIGFVLEAPDAPRIYVSGDNAALSKVRKIAERFGAVEVAILFAGAARVPGIPAPLTLTSQDAANAAVILGARQVVGVHVEDWQHFSESRSNLEAAFAVAGISDRLVATPRGVRVEL